MKNFYALIFLALAQGAITSAADVSEQDPSSSSSLTDSHPELPDFIELEPSVTYRGRSPIKEKINLNNEDYILKRSFKTLIKDAHKAGLPWIMVAYNYSGTAKDYGKDYGDANAFLNWHDNQALDLTIPHMIHNRQTFSPTFYIVRITDNPNQPLAVTYIGNELDLKDQNKPLIHYLIATNPNFNDAQKSIAMNNLGYMLKKQDRLELSKHWYQLAAEKGTTDAMNNLESMLKGQAKHWYQLATEKGNTDAMNNLGSMLKKQGRLGLAKHWYQLAAEKGNADAMNNLGSMLIKQGYLEQAKHLYLLATKKGNTDAMNTLGRLYEEQGNIDDAIKWRRAAEAKGDIYALIALLYLANTYADKFTQEELAEYIHKFLTLKAANHPDIQSYEQELPDRFQAALHVVNRYATQEVPMEIEELAPSASMGNITELAESEDESALHKRKRSEEEAESSGSAQKRQAMHIDLTKKEE